LLITGNVRRGRHFRGNVPYRSATSFGSSLGSSSLNSFLRDTAGSEDLRTYSNKYGTQPYYSPAETVTTMMPGQSEIFRPASARMGTHVQQDTRSAGTDVSGLEFQPKEQVLFGQDLQRRTTQYGPLAQSRLMLESKFPTNMSSRSHDTGRLEPAQIGIRRQKNQTPSFELFREQIQGISDRTQDSMSIPGNERWANLPDNNTSFQYPGREAKAGNVTPKYESQKFPTNITGDEKYVASNHYNYPALKGLKSSMDPKTQSNLFLQKDKYSSVMANQFQATREQNAADTFETGTSDTSGKFRIGQDREQGDVLERVRQQLDDLTKALDATTQSQDAYKNLSTETASKQEKVPLGYKRYVPDSHQVVPRQRIDSNGNLNSNQPRKAGISFEGQEPAPAANRRLNRVDGSGRAGLEFTGISNYPDSQKRSSSLHELNKLSQAEISAEANRIMGHHRNHESLSGAKFNQHMDEAEEHLKAGRYYRAAGCFSLASVYQPGNPMALAGRGHALFAAGEYVSSALFLSRALTANPEYLLTNVDLAAIVGDENKLAVRIADIEQWLARSGSSQLQFLLGYVYYRTGRMLQAKQVIDAAYEKTPDSPAVQAMKIVIGNIEQ
jgi:tetratricopeptide (TPR) repeat protein